MPAPTLRCSIEQLGEWFPHLFVEPQVVACVSVMARYSARPARFEVECSRIASHWPGSHRGCELVVDWSEGTLDRAERLRATVQSRTVLEMASTAIALILVRRVVDLGRLDVTQWGDRADFRSLDTATVLEISGMESASEAAFQRRHRAKVIQALANPFRWDAYVVVCAFSDERHRVRFSFHSQRER